MKLRILNGVAVLALCVSPAFAKGNPHGHQSHDTKQSHAHDRDDHKGHDRNAHGDHDRDHHEHQAKARPAGWDKGKKTGWGNCHVPPGQAKKSGCNAHVNHHDRDHHDRDHHVSERHVSGHHERTAQTKPAPRPYPTKRTTSTTTRTTTTTPTATKGEHPFSPTLRKKQEAGTREIPVHQANSTK
jgi:hypothetical protein